MGPQMAIKWREQQGTCLLLLSGQRMVQSAEPPALAQPPAASGTRPSTANGMPPIQALHLHQLKTKGSPPAGPCLALLPPLPLSPKLAGSPSHHAAFPPSCLAAFV